MTERTPRNDVEYADYVAAAQAGDWEGALSAVAALCARAPTVWIYHQLRGTCLLELGRCRDAAGAYWQGYDLGGGARAAQSLAGAIRLAGDLQSALKWYERSMSIERTELGYMGLAWTQLKLDRADESILTLSRAAKEFPANDEIHAQLSAVYWFLGQAQEAVAALRRALEVCSTELKWWIRAADYSMKSNRPREAVSFAIGALRLAPADAAAKAFLSRALLECGRGRCASRWSDSSA